MPDGPEPGRRLSLPPWPLALLAALLPAAGALLGLTAAAALVLYASFLGTEGPVYRWLRQYGTVVYFGFTCLCLLLAGDAMMRLAANRRVVLPRALPAAFAVLAALLVALGRVNALVAALFDATVKARIENVTEWWGALVFVLGFAALASIWRRLGLRVTIAPPPRCAVVARPPPARPGPARRR